MSFYTLTDGVNRKRVLSKNRRRALAFIADEVQKGTITDAQAGMLQKQVIGAVLGESLRIDLESSNKKITRKTHRLERKIAAVLRVSF